MKKIILFIIISIIIIVPHIIIEYSISTSLKKESSYYPDLSNYTNIIGKLAVAKPNSTLFLRDKYPIYRGKNFRRGAKIGVINANNKFEIIDVVEVTSTVPPELWLNIRIISTNVVEHQTGWIIGRWKEKIMFFIKDDYTSIFNNYIRFIFSALFTTIIYFIIVYLNGIDKKLIINIKKLKISYTYLKCIFVYTSYYCILIFITKLFSDTPEVFRNPNVFLKIIDWSFSGNNFIFINFVSAIIFYKILK